MEPPHTRTSPAVPIAIICGFALIAVAIYFTNNKQSEQTPPPTKQTETQTSGMPKGQPVPINDTDYIRGNPNAPIVIIEYSDYDCPFCKRFHESMQQVMDEYGVGGKLAWVYRQFPIAALHPNAPKLAETALCVGDIGGPTAFWEFTDLLYADRDETELTNITKLPSYVTQVGVSIEDQEECLKSERMLPLLKSHVADGLNVGVEGTPYSVIVVGSQKAVINGAQPYDVVKRIVSGLIDQLEGSYAPSADSSATPTLEQ